MYSKCENGDRRTQPTKDSQKGKGDLALVRNAGAAKERVVDFSKRTPRGVGSEEGEE